MHPDKLVSRIKAVLSGDTGHFEVQGLALEYSELVMHVRDRIDQCVTLIRAGDNYAALQVAESPPPLLDTAAKLAFAESPQWLEFCRRRNIPWPPALEQRNIDLINSLYGQRISESHPLYRDYRTAIRERDELRALGILASIIRINPDDRNARQEFIRLGEKARNIHLHRLEELLDAQDDTAAFALAEALENLHLHTLANAPTLLRARERREAAEREKARMDVLAALKQAMPLYEAGNWQAVIPCIGRCRALEHNFKLDLDESSHQQLSSLEKWAACCENEENARRAREKNIIQANQKLADIISLSANFRSSRNQLRLAVERLQSAINQARSLAATTVGTTPAIDDALLNQATRLLQKFRQLLRLRNILLVSASSAALILMGIAVFLIQAHFGNIQHRKEALARMEVLRSENRLAQAETWLASLSPHWDSEPDFAAAKKQFAAWIADNRLNADNALIEAARLAAPTDIRDSATLEREIAALEKLRQQAETLPVDINAAVQKHLAETTTRFNTFRANIAASTLPDFVRQLETASTDFTRIRAIGSLQERLAAFTAFKPVLDKLSAEGRALLFLMPSELALRWQTLATEAADAHAQWLLSERTEGALAEARTLDAYLEVIRANIAGAPSSQSKPLARIFACEAVLKDPANALLTPEARKLWRVATTTPAGMVLFRPGEILPEENLAAVRLTQQVKSMENLFRHTHHKHPIVPKAQGNVVHTVGPVTEERLSFGDGYERRQTAQVFTPNGTIERRSYTLRQFGHLGARGDVLVDARKAPESLFLVQFSRFFDSSTGQISEPLLDTLDRLYTANISLLLKAYLQQEIFKITEMRPAEWGTLFSPSACDNASKLQQLTQGALTQFDWLRPGRWTDRIPALRSFYQSSKASYRAEAEAWLRVFQHMASPGFVFAGHITAERKLHLSTGRPLAGGIAGITPEGHPIFLTIEEALAPAMSGSQSRLRELRSPDLFAEHSPILMLATLPDQAAKLTRFPAGTPLPQNGWLRFTFMTQEQIQNQQENSHKQSVQTSAEPEQAAPTLANAEPSTEPPPAPADDTLR